MNYREFIKTNVNKLHRQVSFTAHGDWSGTPCFRSSSGQRGVNIPGQNGHIGVWRRLKQKLRGSCIAGCTLGLYKRYMGTLLGDSKLHSSRRHTLRIAHLDPGTRAATIMLSRYWASDSMRPLSLTHSGYPLLVNFLVQ